MTTETNLTTLAAAQREIERLKKAVQTASCGTVPLKDMDIEAFMNLRDWLVAAITDKGGEVIDSGMGAGRADIGMELEGYEYSVSIKPR